MVVGLSVVIGSSTIISIFLSIVFYLLIGMVNGLQMISLTALFRIRMPPNVLGIIIKILKLANFDFWQTENIYTAIFNFSDTESFGPTFENAGFEGSNFINGIGTMFAFMAFYALFLIIRLFVIIFCKNKFCARKIRPWFTSHIPEVTIITFILEGKIDISLYSFICAIYVSKEGMGTTRGDVFSNVLAFIMLLPLVYAPFHMLWRACLYRNKMNKISPLNEPPENYQ